MAGPLALALFRGLGKMVPAYTYRGWGKLTRQTKYWYPCHGRVKIRIFRNFLKKIRDNLAKKNSRFSGSGARCGIRSLLETLQLAKGSFDRLPKQSIAETWNHASTQTLHLSQHPCWQGWDFWVVYRGVWQKWGVRLKKRRPGGTKHKM